MNSLVSKNVAGVFSPSRGALARWAFALVAASIVAAPAFAEEGSEDVVCQYSYSSEADDKVVIHIAAPDNSWAKVTVPKNLLPLQEGMKVEFQASHVKEDVAKLTYRNGVLHSDVELHSNFTRDVVALVVSPDLQTVDSATATRRGLGLFRLLMKPESFACRF